MRLDNEMRSHESTSPPEVRPLCKEGGLHRTVQPMVLLRAADTCQKVGDTGVTITTLFASRVPLEGSHNRTGLKQCVLMASETAIASIAQGIDKQRGQ